jgi:protoporphyrinogen oxidase
MRVGIIGGGISGLAAAYYLARRGHQPVVFEAETGLGGLASVFDFGGMTVERYYHFLCGGDDGYFQLCRELGIENRIRFAPARTGFFHDGRQYGFTTPLDLLRFAPIPLSQRIRFGLFALEARGRKEWRQLDELRAAPWLIDRIGRRAYEVIWQPLLSLKFDDRHESISAAWVWHRLHRVARSKGKMGYLEGTTAFLLQTLSDAIREMGGVLHPGRSVAGILEKDGHVAGLRLSDGEVFECERVFSTLPLRMAAEMLPTSQQTFADRLRKVDYIGVACVVLKLARPFTRNFWLNVNDPNVPFNGIIEYTNLNPMPQGDGKIVYVPYYVRTDGPIYQMPDADLFKQSWNALQYMDPSLRESDLIEYRVFHSTCGQGVCPVGFLDIQPPQDAPLRGLRLLDSMFLYPEDRTQSGLILHARESAALVP